MDQPDAYELFRQGTELLESGDHHAATVPLGRARELAPDKDSVREAYGRALFLAQRFSEAAEEFEAIVEHTPTNDYAQFCLGRSLQLLGRHTEARKPLALACCLRPERADYRMYRDRSRARGLTPASGGRLRARVLRCHARCVGACWQLRSSSPAAACSHRQRWPER